MASDQSSTALRPVSSWNRFGVRWRCQASRTIKHFASTFLSLSHSLVDCLTLLGGLGTHFFMLVSSQIIADLSRSRSHSLKFGLWKILLKSRNKLRAYQKNKMPKESQLRRMKKQSHYIIGSKKGKEEKTHKKRSKSGKSIEQKAKRVTAEKDPNMLEHPPTAVSLFWERFRKECEEIDLDSANNAQRINKMAVTTWMSMTNEDKKPYLDKAAKFKAKYEKLMAKRGQEKDGGYV